MRPEQFTPDAPGRLVPAGGGAFAFVPDPLPDDLSLGYETVNRIAWAENALGRVHGPALREVSPVLVAGPLRRREALLSSRIEGTRTTPEALLFRELEVTPPRPGPADDDALEVANHVAAFDLGLRRLRSLPASLRLVREMHARLLRGVRGERDRPGEFRVAQNFVGPPGAGLADARFVPPPVAAMHGALADLERCMNPDSGPAGAPATFARMPLLVRLALVHYQFEAIHPFRDGNGRVGRMLVPLLFAAERRIGEPLLFMSGALERRRTEYYDRLLDVSRRGAWTEWIDFFLDAVAAGAEEAAAHLASLLELRASYRSAVSTARSSALLGRLVDHLFSTPAVTIGEACRLGGVSHAAAASNLRRLVGAGILREATGRRRNQLFVADGILRVIRPEGREGRGPRA